MNVVSKSSGHWTDDQLIEHLYEVGPADNHLSGCAECQLRLSGMQNRLRAIAPEEVGIERLAAQRRRVYVRITGPVRSFYRKNLYRWAAAGTAALVIGGSLVYYQERQQQQARDGMLSDAQLAQDVSRMSESPEAQPAEPLQALFERE